MKNKIQRVQVNLCLWTTFFRMLLPLLYWSSESGWPKAANSKDQKVRGDNFSETT